MADGNGNVTREYKQLTLADVDRINELAYKAKGIIATLRCASSQFAGPQNALEGACWAAESLIEEMERIATEKENGNG
jgi:hypothetical protein